MPAQYTVTMSCGDQHADATITVLEKEVAAAPAAPKQVVKVPSGAPRTESTDGPVAAHTGEMLS
jgi:hypothetical protein